MNSGFCGKNVKQNEEHTEVTLEQVDAIECLDFQEIDKHPSEVSEPSPE